MKNGARQPTDCGVFYNQCIAYRRLAQTETAFPVIKLAMNPLQVKQHCNASGLATNGSRYVWGCPHGGSAVSGFNPLRCAPVALRQCCSKVSDSEILIRAYGGVNHTASAGAHNVSWGAGGQRQREDFDPL